GGDAVAGRPRAAPAATAGDEQQRRDQRRAGVAHAAPHRARLGSSESCTASPSTLKASTVATSAMPGASMYHQVSANVFDASAIICPQLAVGGCIPTPRKD